MSQLGALKRRKELARQEKQREKLARREQRRTDKKGRDETDGPVSEEDPDIAGIIPGPQPIAEE